VGKNARTSMLKNVLLFDGQPICDDLRLVMFDKDGTIIDVHHYWVSMIALRARKFATRYCEPGASHHHFEETLMDAMGVDLATNRLKAEGPVGIKPRKFIVETVAKTIQALRKVDPTAEEIEEVFQEIDLETAKDMRPLLRLLPGVQNFLNQCRAHDIQMAIVTTDIAPRAKAAMESLQLGHYFQAIVGSDQVRDSKPAADLAQLAMKLCGTSPFASAMIGDHLVDVLMGRNSGVSCSIGVLTGLADSQTFQGTGCHVVESLEQLSIQQRP